MSSHRPIITHVSQLEEHSSWREYKRGMKELQIMEAPKSILLDFKYKAARECFLAFCEIMKGNDLQVVDFHEIIGSAFEDLANRRNRRLIVSCPPRSGKSMMATMFLAWLLGRDQKTQHIVASYGNSLSNKFHKEAVQMMKSKDFKKIFPEWSGFSPDSKYDMLGGGFILSTSVGGVLTGFSAGSTDMESPGVGAMIIDDPLKSSDSKQALENLESWWAEQASTRRTNHYCQLVIATRFHEKDLHGILMDGDGLYDPEDNPFGWRWVNIAGLCEEPENDPLGREIGESHWPSNNTFTVSMLESQKKIMGSFKFAALYQGVPKAAEGQIVKNSWIHVIEEKDCPKLDVTWFGIDCAFSEREMSDESVICVAGISSREPGTVYIREIVKGRWGFPDLIESVKQQQTFHRARVLCIEKAASGHSLIQMLKKEAKIPIEEMKPIRSKTVRLQAVCPLLENGRVKIVEGLWTAAFVKELTSFPFVRHDDSVDAFVWSLTYYSLHLDSVDRALQDSIIQSRKWSGDFRRPHLDDKTYSGAIEPGGFRSRGRNLSMDHTLNDPDFSSLGNAPSRRGSRGVIRGSGYNLFD
jgi:predicted phage terminase large subunit-like protein